jgi:hypothetical protein
MKAAPMNKLARPACPGCEGTGAIRIARSLENAGVRERKDIAPFGVGFKWVDCPACNGGGRR